MYDVLVRIVDTQEERVVRVGANTKRVAERIARNRIVVEELRATGTAPCVVQALSVTFVKPQVDTGTNAR